MNENFDPDSNQPNQSPETTPLQPYTQPAPPQNASPVSEQSIDTNQGQGQQPSPASAPQPAPAENFNASQSQSETKNSSSIIVVLLLVFLLPIGLIYMWLATKWRKAVKWLITIVFVILPIILIGTTMVLSSRHKTSDTTPPVSSSSSQQTTGDVTAYQASVLNISFSYPKSWTIEDNGNSIRIGKVSIQKYPSLKDTSVTLHDFIVSQVTSSPGSTVKSSDIKVLAKTTNGYEQTELITTRYVSNGETIIQLDAPIDVSSSTIDQIVNSITFN